MAGNGVGSYCSPGVGSGIGGRIRTIAIEGLVVGEVLVGRGWIERGCHWKYHRLRMLVVGTVVVVAVAVVVAAVVVAAAAGVAVVRNSSVQTNRNPIDRDSRNDRIRLVHHHIANHTPGHRTSPCAGRNKDYIHSVAGTFVRSRGSEASTSDG